MNVREIPRKQASFLIRYALQSFGIIVLVAILVRSFIFSSYAMSGSAMLPSVFPGDFLVGSKVRLSAVKRGTVVALRCPLLKDKLCLKRIVALPGDRVEFKANALIINGQAAQYFRAGTFEIETIAGTSWAIWPTNTQKSPLAALVVPPQNVYLLNDKRADRDDSRSWGPVRSDMLEARVISVWMSLDWYDNDRVRGWPRVRWERLFRSID